MKRPLLPESETQFQSAVVQLAGWNGWVVMHVHKMRTRDGKGARTPTTVKGWPDLTLWRPRTGEFLIRELKKDGEYPTPDQRRVLADLEACGVNVGVWRPKNWDDEIVPTLTARKDRGRAS